MRPILNTNKIFRCFLLVVLAVNLGHSQGGSSALRYGQYDIQAKSEETKNEDLDLSVSSIPLEKPVDPDVYVVGPGDKFGINIVSTENIVLKAMVGPVGDIMIPSVGVIDLRLQTLSNSIRLIQNAIRASYKNALINVTLLEIRSFKLQVAGAVNSPGFVIVNPFDRLSDVIVLAAGFNKYADENNIIIKSQSGEGKEISFQNYLITGDLENNPSFKAGDLILINYLPEFQDKAEQFTTGITSAIFVIGYVKYPGAYKFFPGFSVEDCISLAGGMLNSGTKDKITVIRNGETFTVGLSNYVKPGDQIYVTQSLRHRLIGVQNVLTTITNVATLFLTYIAATK